MYTSIKHFYKAITSHKRRGPVTKKKLWPKSYSRVVKNDNKPFLHYCDPIEGGHNGATIAFRENKNGGIDAAVAICDPRDRFDVRQGQIRALGRLNSANQCHPIGSSLGEFCKWLMVTPNAELHIRNMPTYAEIQKAELGVN